VHVFAIGIANKCLAKLTGGLLGNTVLAENARSSRRKESSNILLVYQDQSDKEKEKGERLVDLLWWAIHDGQKFAPELHYAPLPQSVVEKAEQQINSISYKGVVLHRDNR